MNHNNKKIASLSEQTFLYVMQTHRITAVISSACSGDKRTRLPSRFTYYELDLAGQGLDCMVTFCVKAIEMSSSNVV
jgi:hypothetical protein